MAAGKWEDARQHFGIVVAADAQAWILSQKGVNTLVHYRVLNGATPRVLRGAPASAKTQGDADDEGWAVTRLVHNGDTLVHELKDGVTLNYKLVTPAPAMK